MNNTEEPKFLSELIKLNDIQKGILNLITTPTGSGKSYFALQKLSTLTARKKIVYLIDSVVGRDQILKNNDNVQEYSHNWRDELLGLIDFENATAREVEDKIVVITYAKFGTILKYNPEIIEKINMIIADELHEIFWRVFNERSTIAKENPLLSQLEVDDFLSKRCANFIALSNIEFFSTLEDKYAIGLTATPDKVRKYFKEDINEILINSRIVAYDTIEVSNYRSIKEEIYRLKKGQKALIFITQIKSIKKNMELARERGFKCEAIWSEKNKQHPLSEEQKETKAYLVDEQKIPNDIDILFINKSCETSINIFSHLDLIIVNTRDPDTITQARGRFRHDLKMLRLLGDLNNTEVVVPDEFLDRPLDVDDKNLLCDRLCIRNDKGEKVKWTTVKKILIEKGYEVESCRINNKRCDVIRE